MACVCFVACSSKGKETQRPYVTIKNESKKDQVIELLDKKDQRITTFNVKANETFVYDALEYGTTYSLVQNVDDIKNKIKAQLPNSEETIKEINEFIKIMGLVLSTKTQSEISDLGSEYSGQIATIVNYDVINVVLYGGESPGGDQGEQMAGIVSQLEGNAEYQGYYNALVDAGVTDKNVNQISIYVLIKKQMGEDPAFSNDEDYETILTNLFNAYNGLGDDDKSTLDELLNIENGQITDSSGDSSQLSKESFYSALFQILLEEYAQSNVESLMNQFYIVILNSIEGQYYDEYVGDPTNPQLIDQLRKELQKRYPNN